MKEVIKFNKVNKSYASKNVLNELSFEIKENEYVAFLGNNGAGKTTTINLICNLDLATTGEVLMFENKLMPQSVSYRNNMGIVLNSANFVESFAVKDYLLFCGKFQHLASSVAKERVQELIALIGLSNYQNTQISKLSSGLQRKVSIAASLIHNPQLLIYDEPFINLDFQTVNELLNLLKSLRGNKTLFITSHNIDVVCDLCDRFLILSGGSIVFETHRQNYSNAHELEMVLKHELGSSHQPDHKRPSWLT